MTNVDQPFRTIEDTREYLSLLSAKLDEVLNEARLELSACKFEKHGQRGQAWQVALYTITKLSSHIANSRKLLSNLDTLRNFLDADSAVGAPATRPHVEP
jgi:hypothetical protein